MNANVPSIEQLQEIALPAPVSYAPQTWGWWVLLAVLLLAVLLTGTRRYRQWRRDRYRREALTRLAQLQRSEDPLSALRELPEVLKRVALSMPPKRNKSPVGASLLAKAAQYSALKANEQPQSRAGPLPQGPAALSGEAWQTFLVRHSLHPLPADFSAQLAQLAYATDATLLALPPTERQRLFATCTYWVEHHVAA